MTNRLLKIDQVADAIGVTQKTIRLWCQAGDVFPTARKLGNKATGQWRILSDDIALKEMLDGAADNTAMLAAQNKQIAELQAQLAQCIENTERIQKDYGLMMQDYNGLVSELQKSDRTIAEMKDQIADLSRYKTHYDETQKRMRSAA